MTGLKSTRETVRKAGKLRTKAARLRQQAEDYDLEAIRLLSASECHQAASEISAGKGKVAVFLGAGASRAFGWPLTNELLPIILDGLIEHDLFEDDRINSRRANAADRDHLKKALIALCPGMKLNRTFLAKNRHRLPLVTSLLSMLDYSLSSGQALVKGLSLDDVKSARVLLERAIYESIEHKEQSIAPRNWPAREPNLCTKRFAKWLDKIRTATTDLAVITSNYDVAMEKVWEFNNDNRKKIERLAVDFGFDWIWPSNEDEEIIVPRAASPRRRLYKLHGSTNWLRCGLCDRTYINPEVSIAVYAYNRKINDDNSCHCGHARLEVQIVSPSFVREVKAPNLISVWQRALNWLRRADHWIIIGYSFPDEDLNIRSLFTRALASRGKQPLVTAIQSGANEQIRTRYETFFPARQMRFLSGGLETFLDNVN